MQKLGMRLVMVFCVLWAGATWADGNDHHDGQSDDTDLQAWSTRIDTPRRFVVLKDFNGEAVLDRETNLVWEHLDSLSIRLFKVRSIIAMTGRQVIV